ncbi:MAG: recombinase family protein [Clostridiales bacterium]|nr:recombinase family protein [Clostridiales bacterium]
MVYAYGRVSAADQNLNRQIDSFIQFGVGKAQIYTDKKSGKDFDRENYRRLKSILQSGDLLVVKSIDRLGRNYDMIIEEWADITRRIGADIFVMDMPLLDTRTNRENLTGKLISDLVLQILSYVAQKERENIKVRQKEGIAAAKRRGVRFGRPEIVQPTDFTVTATQFKNGTISCEEALARTGMKKSTFYSRLKSLDGDAYG